MSRSAADEDGEIPNAVDDISSEYQHFSGIDATPSGRNDRVVGASEELVVLLPFDDADHGPHPVVVRTARQCVVPSPGRDDVEDCELIAAMQHSKSDLR
jgi:hypothetical protein